jgi:hypothetical protein
MSGKCKKRNSCDVRRLVVTSKEQVPDGYVRLSSFNKDQTLHKAVSGAPITSVRVMKWDSELRTGPVWLEPTELQSFLEQYESVKRFCHPSVKACAKPQDVAAEVHHKDDQKRIASLESKVDGLVDKISSLLSQLS